MSESLSKAPPSSEGEEVSPRQGGVPLTSGRKLLSKLLIVSILLTLLGLGVTAIHFVWPTPLMFTLFMTVGQGSFLLAMALYVVVIVADLRRRGVL